MLRTALQVMGHNIDLDGITNPVLRRVIKERMGREEFMFHYGDHREHTELYSEYRTRHGETERKVYYRSGSHTDANDGAHTDQGSHGYAHTDSREHRDSYY